MAGLAAGLGAVVLMAPVLRPAAGPAPLPLTVHAHAARSGEVGLVAGGQLLSSAPVRPGSEGATHGTVEIASQTWSPMAVAVRETGPASDAEDEILVRVALDGEVLFDGQRSQLRSADSEPVRLDPGQRADLDVTVSLADGADSHQGRTADITLTIVSTAVED